MRVFFRLPKILGVYPGFSFGPEDFRQLKTIKAPNGTKSDFAIVYAIKGDHNRIKIGVTQNPARRIAALKTASLVPEPSVGLG
jgi:hypothetical protein